MAVIERSNVIEEAAPQTIFQKAGTLSSNDFAGECVVGSLAIDTSSPKLYQCSATNGSSTSTWVAVGGQS